MRIIKTIQKSFTDYGYNYILYVYKTQIRVEKFFTNGWQNTDFDIRNMKLSVFEELHGELTDNINPEWVFEVAMDR